MEVNESKLLLVSLYTTPLFSITIWEGLGRRDEPDFIRHDPTTPAVVQDNLHLRSLEWTGESEIEALIVGHCIR